MEGPQKRRAQAHRPIRSVLKGQHKCTNHHIVSQSREGAVHPIIFVWQGALADASSHQKEALARANQIHRSDYLRTDFLRADFLRKDFLWTDPPSSRNRRISQPDPSIGVFRSDYLRTVFLRTDPPSSWNRRISQPDPSIGVIRTDYLWTDFLRTNLLSVRNLKIGPAHEWSRTARVTQSPSPPEYDRLFR